ncbi:MAG: 30S ribosomal protein S7, partial [Kiritimatiellae bacterium]|nr:30S ribosomal protein S7 [Kiritimatiellia bacterium]
MSRRAKKIEKRVTLDPKYNSELVAHMIRVVMKDGKKTTAEKIVYGAIDKLKEAIEKTPEKFVKEEKQYTDALEVLTAAID